MHCFRTTQTDLVYDLAVPAAPGVLSGSPRMSMPITGTNQASSYSAHNLHSTTSNSSPSATTQHKGDQMRH